MTSAVELGTDYRDGRQSLRQATIGSINSSENCTKFDEIRFLIAATYVCEYIDLRSSLIVSSEKTPSFDSSSADSTGYLE